MDTLPPPQSIVDLPRGRFRAMIARPGPMPGTVQLRGWYLNRKTMDEQTVTVPLKLITLVSTR